MKMVKISLFPYSLSFTKNSVFSGNLNWFRCRCKKLGGFNELMFSSLQRNGCESSKWSEYFSCSIWRLL